jgi:alpha-amylase/alpha-mannosidase (GH57 family)
VPKPHLVVHGHFYQPPRENPWTEEVLAEPSAAPYHDWNARITAESYRPNGWARVVDDHGRVVAIVNDYRHLSFNVGPTLCSWLEEHAPDVADRMVEGDREGGGGIAQAYNHMILPLATERDARTQVRWGLADFRHRFGREPEGIWLPETAVDDTVLRILAEEGVGFTLLAPGQAKRVRPMGEDRTWTDVTGGRVDTRRSYRWRHPERPDLGVDLVFYHGGLSHDIAFGVGRLGADELLGRVRDAAGDRPPPAPEGEDDPPPLVCIATDGETFGHHHRYAERLLAYVLPYAGPRSGLAVTTVAEHLRDHPPRWEAKVHRSAWSCAHGVGRWSEDCGCSTGGSHGADQRWRQPLRAALDLARDVGVEVFERRGAEVFPDPWGARDAYGAVLSGAVPVEEFLADHVADAGDEARRVEALTLLEQQRHALLMYTSCAWFFWDLAGLETVQCLRYAARALDLLAELGEEPPLDAFLDVLASARSNQPAEGDGRRVWRRHVEPARVNAARAVAHLALTSLLTGEQGERVGAFDVVDADHVVVRVPSLTAVTGTVTLVHRRTGRRVERCYAALHGGGYDVVGASRPANPDGDRADQEALRAAVESLAPVADVAALVRDRFGGDTIGIHSALPGEGDALLAVAAADLDDHLARAVQRAVAATGDEASAAADAAVTLLDVADAAGHPLRLEPLQEQVYEALLAAPGRDDLRHLGERVGLAVERLGAPG